MKKEILSLKISVPWYSIRKILLYVDTIERNISLTDPNKDEGLTFGAIQILERVRSYKSQYLYPIAVKLNTTQFIDWIIFSVLCLIK